MSRRYYYDLHIHSCLSPCADNDMTPSNIAGMATIAGVQIVALTDHNTVKNCPAFFKYIYAKMLEMLFRIENFFEFPLQYFLKFKLNVGEEINVQVSDKHQV